MSVRDIARTAALRVPPIRRLHAYAVDQTSRAAQAEECAAAASKERDRLLGELAALSEERDTLELQLYVLRSDYQRLVSRSEASTARVAELETATAQRSHVEPAHLEALYAKLSGRLTRGFGELSARLSVAYSDSSAFECTRFYLDLLEQVLTGRLLHDEPIRSKHFDPEVHAFGRGCPSRAPTMIGTARMRNIRALIELALAADVPGDFLAAGVSQCGACIYMRGILAAHGVRNRTVWVAGSFEGLPRPESGTYTANENDRPHTVAELDGSLEEVRASFQRYGLLDDQVQFVRGRFTDTLPGTPIERLAMLRLNGDLYSSIIPTMEALYTKISPGGFVIVDEYNLPACRRAVDDFRDRHGIVDEMEDIDGAGVFWRKTG
jgi:hypothetical protein